MAQSLTWRENSSKALVMIGDSPPHPPSYTKEAIWWKDEVDKLASIGVKIYGVHAQANNEYRPFYEEMAKRTGGLYIKFSNFSLITDMFLAVCYREANKEKLQEFANEIKQDGRMTEAMTQMMDSLAAPNMEKVKEEEKMEEKPTYPYDWWDRRNDRWWPQYKLLDGRWVGINVNSVPGCTPPSSSSLSSSTSTSSSYVPGTAASYKPSSSTAASSESSIKPGEVEDYKIIVTGGRGVGKAALCVQFIQNVFLTGYDPERDDSYNKLLSIDGKNCMVHLLDLVGEEEHSVMRGVYLNNAQGFVIMYSITDKSSFDSLNTCRERILHSKGVASIPCVLVGNKVDLESERQVTAAEATALAASWNVPFFETSARIRVHVDESFYEMVREIRRANAPPPSKCNVM